MKLVKTASGKSVLSIDKGEWAKIGLEKGWMMSKAQTTPVVGSAPEADSLEPVWKCRVCGRTADAIAFTENENCCPFCEQPYIDKFQ
jgi:rubrerythrin